MERFEARKNDHIRLALDGASQVDRQWSGLDAIQLVHEALPELDFEKVTLQTDDWISTATPFVISGMTAGHENAGRLNALFAEACQTRGWIFGLGSMRRDVEADLKPLENWIEFRRKFPKLSILGNIGLGELIRLGPTPLLKLIDALQPQGFVVHLNPLQEALQPEGNTKFEKGAEAIHSFVSKTKIPVIAKETGCGISKRAATLLSSSGVKIIDVSGLGGTHWGRIEGARSATDSTQSLASQTFKNWGIPLTDSITYARQNTPLTTAIWASGGIRSGLDAAKCLGLGASRVGFARPALEAAISDVQNNSDGARLLAWMQTVEFETRLALFCSGCESPKALNAKENAWIRLNHF